MERFGQTFTTMSEVIAALEATKLEFNRAVVGPYEDRKRASNGSISTLDKTGPEVLKMAEEAFDQPTSAPEPYPYSLSPRYDNLSHQPKGPNEGADFSR